MVGFEIWFTKCRLSLSTPGSHTLVSLCKATALNGSSGSRCGGGVLCPLVRLVAGCHGADHFREDRSRVAGHAIMRRSRGICESPASGISPSSLGHGVLSASTLFRFAEIHLLLSRDPGSWKFASSFHTSYVGPLWAGILRILYRFIWSATEPITLRRDASS